MNWRTLALVLPLALLPMAACMSPKGDTVQEKRAHALAMRDEAVQKFCARDPHIKEDMDRYPGYVVWSGGSIHPGILSFAAGYMVATDRTTNQVHYRKLLRFGLGPGFALKGFYGIAVVKNEEMLKKFMSESSFNMGAGAEGSFVFGDFGGSAVAEQTFSSELYSDIYTHTGVALELLVAGVWTWPNKELNEAEGAPAAATP